MKRFHNTILALVFLTGFPLFGQQTFRQQIHDFIAMSNANFDFVYLGEFIHNDSALVFFWPCIIQQQLADEKIKMAILTQDMGEWTIVDLQDPTQIDELTKQNLLSTFSCESKKKLKTIPQSSIGDTLHVVFRRVDRCLQKSAFPDFIKATEEASLYFGAQALFFSAVFTDVIFKGIDQVDMELLSQDDKNMHVRLFFTTTNHEYGTKAVLAKKDLGYYIKSITKLE